MARYELTEYSDGMAVSPSPNVRLELPRRRDLCYVNVVEGDLEPSARRLRESDLFGRLAEARVAVTMVVVNDGSCSFAVDTRDVARVQTAASGINMAVRIRARCTLVILSFAHDGHEEHLARVMAAVAAAKVTVVYLAMGVDTVSVLVDDEDGTRAADALQCCAQSLLRAA